MKLIAIVAMSFPNSIIGLNGAIPWHLPKDLKRFKELTTGYPVIMGRKTHESIGGLLKGRMNIVVTRKDDYETKAYIAHSLDDAIEVIEIYGPENVDRAFIIGGAELYREALPRCQELLRTVVNAPDVAGDTFFMNSLDGFELTSHEVVLKDDKNQYDMRFERWIRC
jgi:dihydrofolate reductase